MSNILVTGGSGFIGSHIIETLKEANHKVFNIDKNQSNFGCVFGRQRRGPADFWRSARRNVQGPWGE